MGILFQKCFEPTGEEIGRFRRGLVQKGVNRGLIRTHAERSELRIGNVIDFNPVPDWFDMESFPKLNPIFTACAYPKFAVLCCEAVMLYRLHELCRQVVSAGKHLRQLWGAISPRVRNGLSS